MGGLMRNILQRTELGRGIGVVYIALGVGLLLPIHTFAGNPAYWWVSEIVSEWGLGLVSLVIGAWSVVAANAHGLRSRHWAMLALTGLSVFYMTMFWQGNPTGTGVWVFGGLTLASAWAAIDAAWRQWWMN